MIFLALINGQSFFLLRTGKYATSRFSTSSFVYPSWKPRSFTDLMHQSCRHALLGPLDGIDPSNVDSLTSLDPLD